ncbi:MAG: aldehyde ferredoxin oxidoreductase family protein [Chloroflexi bacterium]|nr:aldehyde ferredoxin oxidoreductase family protein [Chloroflexota bacterium]MBI5350665.1 aldehyde ferredoxin oxidoreductase family protein [Chloroflexota bacterium]
MIGKLLVIDLTHGTTGVRTLDPQLFRDFVGGASLAAKLLYESLTPSLDPLSPDNPLLFLTGPLTGSSGPAVGRYVVCAKSPLTNIWAESNCGGFFGPEIRFAGYDGILFTGRASSPVYVWIKNETVELRDASHLWGGDTYETQTRIKNEVNDSLARVACIGMAGERLIPYALILNDHGRVAGRTGMGAVMGSKNLKAIAVRGGSPLSFADPTFNQKRSRANLDLRNDNVTQVLREMGSSGASDYFNYLGEMPVRYFSRSGFENIDKVSGATMAETILSGVSTCHACVIACGRKVILPDGDYKRGESKGPEYETIVGFGPNLEISDLAAITHLGQLCDSLGVDSISMSGTIGLAFMLYQQGVITAKDTNGLELKWGEARTVEKLIHLALTREGFGELLARGSKALAKHFGVEEMAVQVNGLEVAYHDPRGATGMGLVYATSPRGACHNQSDYFMVEIGNSMSEIGVEMADRAASEGKALSVARHQWWRTLNNSLVMCVFANVPFNTARELINAATGFDYSAEEFLRCGERGWALKRAINNRLGVTAKNDTLPRALLTPLSEGGAAGVVINLQTMLKEYYEVQGWDAVTGKPTRSTLERLGLKDIIEQ